VSERLVEQARRGDADAFVALIEERQVAMTRVATAILRDPADVADALQETLVSLWRELPRLRSIDAFPAWADRVLVNACRLVLRRRGRRRVHEIALAEGQAARGDAVAGSGRAAAFDTELAEREAFDRSFETLDGEARAILVLHHLEGRTVNEIAAVLGIPVGTVKSRLFTARRRLENALEREGSGTSARDLAPGTGSR
jgi:RNA polymerase sigma-70 factor (ECF subfamily)